MRNKKEGKKMKTLERHAGWMTVVLLILSAAIVLLADYAALKSAVPI